MDNLEVNLEKPEMDEKKMSRFLALYESQKKHNKEWKWIALLFVGLIFLPFLTNHSVINKYINCPNHCQLGSN